MSSKLFTWTKGDRKASTDTPRLGGTESVSPEGIAQANDVKKPRISFHGSPSTPNSKHSRRTTDSFALQDAAVQSATHLIAVMNSVLSSPHLSAHIDAQMSASRGRQRSHTAPPPPRVEVSAEAEPAELPGSFSQSGSAESDRRRDHLTVDASSVVVDDIERPRSSPEEPSRRLPSPRRMSLDERRSAGYHSRAFKSFIKPVWPPKVQPVQSDQLPSDNTSYNATVQSTATRPSIITTNTHQSNASTDSSASATPSNPNPSQLTRSTPVELAGTPKNLRHQADSEAALIQQIAYMRASHESHVQSLKDAHSKEIETHRAYIEFLEKRRNLSASSVSDGFRKRSSTDCSNASSSRGSDTFSATNSSTPPTSAASSDIVRLHSPESIAEAESLKRKLSVLRTTQIDSTELRRERDELRESANRADRRILQLKDIIRKAKDNDRALRNAISNLEIRLQAANIQRVDLLEGLEVASSDVRKLSRNERLLMNELHQARQRNANKIPRHHSKSVISQAALASAPDKEVVASTTGASLEQEVERLQTILHEKNARIQQLEHAPSDSAAEQKRINVDIESSLADLKLQLAAAQADCERYNSLLHSELRRQSRSAARRCTVVAPEVEAQACAVVAEKFKSTRFIDTGAEASTADFQKAINLLEQELENCTKEIIMYKLDIKGYKKDLRNAKLEINGLRALNASQRPPTPERDARRATLGRQESILTRLETPGSGLGIRLPKTPVKTPLSALSMTPLPNQTSIEPDLDFISSNFTTSDGHAKDKALPNLPPRPSPTPLHSSSPKFSLRRGDTFRSLGESIISSYAKRATP